MELQGKTAVITGAGSGIGREIAHRFAKAGAIIAVVDIDFNAAHKVAQ
ncbi:MAG: SDR family NAD(P)-dependent oxidoreductase, partial [Gammaproteobacteria bacterium]|nr:SDR family NAD(P)-dependent oxidoreductase [Gammaproteobacteria bacterium]